MEVANFELNALFLPLNKPNSEQQVLAALSTLVKCFLRFMNLGGKTNDWSNCYLIHLRNSRWNDLNLRRTGRYQCRLHSTSGFMDGYKSAPSCLVCMMKISRKYHDSIWIEGQLVPWSAVLPRTRGWARSSTGSSRWPHRAQGSRGVASGRGWNRSSVWNPKTDSEFGKYFIQNSSTKTLCDPGH